METMRYFHQPTISESLGNGWYVMKKYFLWLLLVIFICGIFDGPTRFTYKGENHFPVFMGFAAIFGMAFLILVRPVIAYGGDFIFLQSVRDNSPDLKLLFVGFQQNYFNIILAHLLHTIIVIVGFIFLIIPGIIMACRLAFVPYLVMDKQLDPVKAVETSWEMTRGHGWTIFGMGLMSILILLVGLICLIVGVFPAIIWISASFASLYQAVEHINRKEEEIPSFDPVI